MLHRHLLSGPQLKGGGALVEQHVESIEEWTSDLLGHFQKFCLPWIVDDVGDDKFRPKERSIRDGTGIDVRSHTQTGAVGQDIACIDGGPEVFGVFQRMYADFACGALVQLSGNRKKTVKGRAFSG